MDWLRKEPEGFELVKFITGSIFLKLIIAISVSMLMMWSGVEVTKVRDGDLKIFSISFPFVLLFGAMLEEYVFRLVPLKFVLNRNIGFEELTKVVLVVSAFFGYIHGGIEHVFIQGLGGIVLSVVFLKCGGLNKNYRKAYICSTASHYSFNMILLISAGIMGVEKF